MDNYKLNAYMKIARTTGSPRQTEAEALVLGAQKLIACRDSWDSEDKEDKKELLNEALKFNQKLWSIFQGALISADNPLPKETKLNLLRLSAFVDKQIFKIMAYPSPEKLTPIINVNLGIAAGLRGELDPVGNFEPVEPRI